MINLQKMQNSLVNEIEGFFENLREELETNIEFGVCFCSTHLHYEDLVRGNCRVCKREVKITVET